jgi:hypothetical protein
MQLFLFRNINPGYTIRTQKSLSKGHRYEGILIQLNTELTGRNKLKRSIKATVKVLCESSYHGVN